MILETLFAETLKDYLETAEALAAGLPSPTVLNYIAGHEIGDKDRPLMTVAVERATQTHEELAVLICTFKMEVNVASNGAAGSGFTTPTAAETWMRALRSHLADKETLATHLGTLSESDRTGWKVLLHYMPPHFKPEIDGQDHSHTYEQVLQLTLRVNPPM